MAKKNHLLEWQLWFHYLLLELIVLLLLFFVDDVVYLYFLVPVNFIRLYIVLAVGDQLIHYVLHKTTGWED